jgi:hypothetical protein
MVDKIQVESRMLCTLECTVGSTVFDVDGRQDEGKVVAMVGRNIIAIGYVSG